MRVPHFLNLGFACSVTAMLGAGRRNAQQTASDGGGVLGGRGAAAASLVRASHAARAPVIDGDVLGDPAYEDAPVATGFSQNTPDEGQPASERTEVRIVYTDDTLYFGVVCYTRDPGTIIVADSRRDSQMNDTDSFQIILDTFLDQQNGFVFGTNPAGIEYDGQVSNEGQGSGRMGGGGAGGGSQQQRGSGGGFNLNWDGAWQVEARVTEIGWTAEFRHPVPHAALPRRLRPDLGRQLPAQHPAPQRALVLGAAAAPVQPEPAVARRPAAGPRGAQPGQPQADAVRARRGGPLRHAVGDRQHGELRRRPEVQHPPPA